MFNNVSGKGFSKAVKELRKIINDLKRLIGFLVFFYLCIKAYSLIVQNKANVIQQKVAIENISPNTYTPQSGKSEKNCQYYAADSCMTTKLFLFCSACQRSYCNC